MKRKIIACITAMAAVVGAFGVYAQAPADKLQAQGILQGYEDGELHLERTLTRAEFTKIFCDAFLKDDKDIKDYKSPSFPDIATHWGADYIEKAVAAGVIAGFEDGTFHPDDTVTYEQAIKMIVAYLENDSYYGERKYPEGYIGAALEMGISDGVTKLIGETITREDVVYLVDNALTKIEEEKKAEEEEEAYWNSFTSAYSGSSAAKASGGGSAAISSRTMNTMAADAIDGGVYTEAAEVGMPAPEPYDYDYNGYFNTEEYDSEKENVFKNALTSPLSTFSIDADTASYSNMRRFVLDYATFPTKGSIRTEELINYFSYDNPRPTDGKPFEVSAETAVCPWNSENLLTKIAIQGDEFIEPQPSNLVFLLDISGSMYTVDKLPLVKKSLRMLLDELAPTDTISIVTYASGTETVLESTPVSEKEKILEALSSLHAGGGTYGEAGINLAYEQAEKNLLTEGNNRIILCTDGDFNIGNSSTGELEKLITEKRDKGIFLTVLGFGMGNYKDNRMETLADTGNGTYAYIDSEREAKKVFVDEMPKTLYTIAKDVKIQVEFNPAVVKEYRLVGYENRVLNNEDFDNDKKDAGELGCGATVTAFYEIVPADGTGESGLKYQSSEVTADDSEMMTVKVRYKEPKADESQLIEMPVANYVTGEASEDFKFAASLAELGMLLNDSEFKGSATYDTVIELASEGIGEDELGFRAELLHIADMLRYVEKYRAPIEDDDLIYYPMW